jgi:hypothetical protein
VKYQAKYAAALSVSLAFTCVSACKKDSKPEAAGSATAAVAPTPGESPLGALKNFEGEIGLQVKTSTQSKPVPPFTLSVKNSKLRFDVPDEMGAPAMGGKAHVVLSAPEKALFVVVDDQKQVIKLEFDKLSEQLKAIKPPGAPGARPDETKPPPAPPTVTKTGNKNVVAGYTCEDWNVVSPKGERAQICVASESASFFEVPTVGLPAEQAWAKELFDGQHLPLRLIAYDAAGAEETRIEVTRIARQTEPDTLFDIPKDYKVMDLSEFMKAMLGGLGGPAGLAGTLRPLAPGASTFPPGAQLPPGVALPPGFKLPPGLKLPPGVKPPQTPEELMKMMQEHAKAMGTVVPPPPKSP